MTFRKSLQVAGRSGGGGNVAGDIFQRSCKGATPSVVGGSSGTWGRVQASLEEDPGGGCIALKMPSIGTFRANGTNAQGTVNQNQNQNQNPSNLCDIAPHRQR